MTIYFVIPAPRRDPNDWIPDSSAAAVRNDDSFVPSSLVPSSLRDAGTQRSGFLIAPRSRSVRNDENPRHPCATQGQKIWIPDSSACAVRNDDSFVSSSLRHAGTQTNGFLIAPRTARSGITRCAVRIDVPFPSSLRHAG